MAPFAHVQFGHWQEASPCETSSFEGFGRPWAIWKGKANVSLNELGFAHAETPSLRGPWAELEDRRLLA